MVEEEEVRMSVGEDCVGWKMVWVEGEAGKGDGLGRTVWGEQECVWRERMEGVKVWGTVCGGKGCGWKDRMEGVKGWEGLFGVGRNVGRGRGRKG